MGLSHTPSSIIGGPLDDGVIAQLEARKSIIKKTSGRTTDDHLLLNSATGWVRLSSAVDTIEYSTNSQTQEKEGKGNSTLAKDNVLAGGTLLNTQMRKGIFNGEDSAYTKSKLYGYRPMAGITSFNVATKNQFGTLRTATVGFKANSIEQLDVLEQLYLRPGFTVLLEWGHSLYVTSPTKKEGKLDTTGAGKLVKDPITFIDFFTGKTRQQLRDEIKQNKEKSSHNYDAMYGYIRNFSWSFNLDGGYDCMVDIISEGEIIESISMLVSPSYQEEYKPDGDIDNYYKALNRKTALHTFANIVKNAAETPNIQKIYQPYSENQFIEVDAGPVPLLEKYIPKTFARFKRTLIEQSSGRFEMLKFTTTVTGEDDATNISWVSMIPLRYLLELINIIFIYKDQDGEPLTKFYSGNKEGENRTPFLTFSEHFSVDPSEVMIYNGDPKSLFRYPVEENMKLFGEKTDILNIYVSVNLILETLDSTLGTVENPLTDQDIVSYVKALLGKIQSNLGGVNSFDIHTDFDENIHYIVDRKITPSADNAKPGDTLGSDSGMSFIDLVGLNSQLENLSFQSKLSNRVSNMVAISAQVASVNAGEDVLAMQKWNKGIQDRHLALRTLDVEAADLTNEEAKTYKINDSDLSFVLKYVNGIKLGSTKTFLSLNLEDMKGLTAAHSNLMQSLITYNTIKKGVNPSGLIPFELSFTIKGIGGMKIGQAFRIPDEVIPQKYRGNVAFLITGVEHTIQSNRWVTNIKTQMIIIGSSSEEFKIGKLDLPEYAFDAVGSIVSAPTNLTFIYPLAGGANGNVTRSDPSGAGDFASPRNFGTRAHKAWDILVKKDASRNVYAPMPGKLRIIKMFTTPQKAFEDANFSLGGLEITGTGAFAGYVMKLGYVNASSFAKELARTGREVQPGTFIGLAGETGKAYNDPKMLDHIHVQLRKGEGYIDPQELKWESDDTQRF